MVSGAQDTQGPISWSQVQCEPCCQPSSGQRAALGRQAGRSPIGSGLGRGWRLHVYSILDTGRARGHERQVVFTQKTEGATKDSPATQVLPPLPFSLLHQQTSLLPAHPPLTNSWWAVQVGKQNTGRPEDQYELGATSLGKKENPKTPTSFTSRSEEAPSQALSWFLKE